MSKACLEKLKAGDVVCIRSARYQIIGVINDQLSTVNLSNGYLFYTSVESFYYSGVVKIVKAK